jgi:hypothetical protein
LFLELVVVQNDLQLARSDVRMVVLPKRLKRRVPFLGVPSRPVEVIQVEAGFYHSLSEIRYSRLKEVHCKFYT